MTDFQFFTGPGVWRKPAGAERVDMILRGGDAGPSISGLGGEGEIITHTFDADDLADTINVTGGGGDGSGYAVIVSRKRSSRDSVASPFITYGSNGQDGFGAGGGYGGAGSATGHGGDGGHGAYGGGGGGGGGAGLNGGGRGGDGGSVFLV